MTDKTLMKHNTRLMPLFVLLVAVAWNSAGAAPNAPLLYHNYCSVCHGDLGDGNSRASQAFAPPPRDFTSEQSQRELSRERLIHSIGFGRAGTAMAAWNSQLSEEEISALADHLLTTFINTRQAMNKHPGKPVYEQNCAVCHGDKGDGGRWTAGLKFRPRDFTATDPKLVDRSTMINTVTNGRPGTPMAAFSGQLEVQQIEQVVDYIRIAFMPKSAEISGLSGTYAHGLPTIPDNITTTKPSGINMNAAMPEGLKGDIARGHDFYMRNCFTCHGVNGDGNGPRAYFINPRPANFLLDKYRSKFNRPRVYAAIRDGKNGTEMPAWGKVLNAQQLADVSEFVFRAFIRNEHKTLAAGEKKKP